MSTAIDFKKKDGYEHYEFPQSKAFPPKPSARARAIISTPASISSASSTTPTRLPRPTRRKPGRIFSSRGGAMDELQAFDVRHAVCAVVLRCAIFTATISGRNLPSCSRTRSIARAQLFDRLAKGDEQAHRSRRICGLSCCQGAAAPMSSFVVPGRRAAGNAAGHRRGQQMRASGSRASCSSTGRCRSAVRPVPDQQVPLLRLGAQRRRRRCRAA